MVVVVPEQVKYVVVGQGYQRRIENNVGMFIRVKELKQLRILGKQKKGKLN